MMNPESSFCVIFWRIFGSGGIRLSSKNVFAMNAQVFIDITEIGVIIEDHRYQLNINSRWGCSPPEPFCHQVHFASEHQIF